MIACARAAQDVPIDRVKIASPFNSRVKYNVYAAVTIVPLVGYTSSGARLGMGAGHYDKWLADHPETLAIGLAWDCQEVPALSLERRDRALDAIVTPTRLLGPFER